MYLREKLRPLITPRQFRRAKGGIVVRRINPHDFTLDMLEKIPKGLLLLVGIASVVVTTGLDMNEFRQAVTCTQVLCIQAATGEDENIL
jgi:hypothetical protein